MSGAGSGCGFRIPNSLFSTRWIPGNAKPDGRGVRLPAKAECWILALRTVCVRCSVDNTLVYGCLLPLKLGILKKVSCDLLFT